MAIHAAAEVGGKRKRGQKSDADIVLICNPRAGGRWRALADVLDSEEARYVRRIVTDSVEDIAHAVADLGHEAKLLCIYGGDGTIQRILDRLAPGTEEQVHLALLGGGTMNVTSRWCDFSRDPAYNFRQVVRGYRSGNLLFKEVPILDVTTGGELHRAFTFGMGPVVRLLDAYENGKKGKLAALGTAARAIAAVWIDRPAVYRELLAPMHARITLDGERIPYDGFSAVFANVTGQINPGVEPFVETRTRDTFYCAACAVSAREFTLMLPFLMRGWLPIDLAALLEPGHLLERLRARELLTDPRYVNKTGAHLEIHGSDSIYTVDGEILPVRDNHVSVKVGLQLRLAVAG